MKCYLKSALLAICCSMVISVQGAYERHLQSQRDSVTSRFLCLLRNPAKIGPKIQDIIDTAWGWRAWHRFSPSEQLEEYCQTLKTPGSFTSYKNILCAQHGGPNYFEDIPWQRVIVYINERMRAQLRAARPLYHQADRQGVLDKEFDKDLYELQEREAAMDDYIKRAQARQLENFSRKLKILSHMDEDDDWACSFEGKQWLEYRYKPQRHEQRACQNLLKKRFVANILEPAYFKAFDF